MKKFYADYHLCVLTDKEKYPNLVIQDRSAICIYITEGRESTLLLSKILKNFQAYDNMETGSRIIYCTDRVVVHSLTLQTAYSFQKNLSNFFDCSELYFSHHHFCNISWNSILISHLKRNYKNENISTKSAPYFPHSLEEIRKIINESLSYKMKELDFLNNKYYPKVNDESINEKLQRSSSFKIFIVKREEQKIAVEKILQEFVGVDTNWRRQTPGIRILYSSNEIILAEDTMNVFKHTSDIVKDLSFMNLIKFEKENVYQNSIYEKCSIMVYKCVPLPFEDIQADIKMFFKPSTHTKDQS